MCKLLFAITLSAAAMFGADLTGRWTGTLDMKRGEETRKQAALLIFKQDGANVAGSMGPDAERQFQIKSGRIEGERILIELTPHEEGGPTKVMVELRLDGDDHLLGDLKAETPEGAITAKIDAKREK